LKNKKTFKKTIPGKLQTYLSSGKPIIGMISGEANKIIKKSRSGLVCEADDHVELKNLLIKFIKMSKNKRKIFGINGKKYANKYFNKNKNLNDLEKILIKHVK
jgi:glycosyltransferase involved in cell wall biosynthesis